MIGRRGTAAAALALTALIACGGSDEPDAAHQPKPGRAQTPDLLIQSSTRKPAHKLVLDGVPLSGGRGWLLPVEIKITNRRRRRLPVGGVSAVLTAGGTSYRPIFADGRKAPTPLFADKAIRAGEAVHTLAVYRVPDAALQRAKLRLSDPVRGRRVQLTVF